MARHTLWVSLAITVITSACEKDAQPAFDDGAEIVPADPPVDIPGHPIAGRYWGEIDPMSGRMEIFPLEPGNVIHRGQHQEAVSYNGGGSATFNPGQLTLHTDQTQVSYKDSGGTCHSNGANVNCSTLTAACNATNVFCAPVLMTSSASFALPDVVLQISQNMPTNAVAGCIDSGDGGLCFATGTCATPTSNQDKVDCSSISSFSSPIPGNGTTTHGCSWCYGTASQIGSLPGLKHAVVPGTSSTLQTIDDPKLAFVLSNDQKTLVTINVRYSTPGVQGSNLCYQRGSTMTVTGGGFGPPGSCIADPPSSCPISGSPGTGYNFQFPQFGGGDVAGTSISWSDVSLSATVPLNAAHTGNITITTPLTTSGTVTASGKSCPTISLSASSGTIGGASITFSGDGWLVNGGAGEAITLSSSRGQLQGCGGISANTSGHFSKVCTIKCTGGTCASGQTATVTATGGTSTDTATSATYTFL
jgi:hypothetical protein